MFPLTFPRLTHPTCSQEFGIDIIGEDNKTTIHHKVAARVMCVFTDEDAHLAARVEAIPSSASLPPSVPSILPPATSSSGSGNNFSFAHPQRRPALQSQLGGMGGSMRPPGKNGLSFDHILSRLQGELQKSRETGAELHSLSTAMNDIHDTLGGSVVCLSLLSASLHTDHLHLTAPKPTTFPSITPSRAFTTNIDNICTRARVCRARNPRTPCASPGAPCPF
jgi:hypothetical protein